jgi:hypothetical protein
MRDGALLKIKIFKRGDAEYTLEVAKLMQRLVLDGAEALKPLEQNLTGSNPAPKPLPLTHKCLNRTPILPIGALY